MTLRGPSDPNAFRTSYYGARWYHDPLPGCDVAPATEEKWPSVTTLKKAWSSVFRKRWTDGQIYDLDPLRVALYVDEQIQTLAKLSTAERVPLMASAAKRGLNQAAQRGTDVHSYIELLCAGNAEFVPSGATEYAEVCQRIVTELAPEIDFAEVVAIRRDPGWAGTPDVIARVAGRRYLIDWKSRAAESSHGAYDTEAAQIGAYSLSDYLIAEVDGEARRVPMPELDGLLVISIKPDSYEVFPVDLEKAQEAAHQLHASWKAKREGQAATRKAIGKPVLLAAPRADTPPAAAANRVIEDTPKRRGNSVPLPDATTPPPKIEEGEIVPDAIDVVRRAVEARLTSPQTATLRAWVKDGRAPHQWAMHEATQTRRRFDLHRAAIRLVAAAWDDDTDQIDDDLARAVIATVIGDDIRQPSVRIGAALGAMTLDEASRLAEICTQIEKEPERLRLDDAGHWTVAA